MKKIVLLIVVFMVYGLTVCAADGDLVVGGDISVTGNIGVGPGASAPTEKLEVDGAVTLGDAVGTEAGTIRWDGTNFQGYNGSEWVNLDASGGLGAPDFEFIIDGSNAVGVTPVPHGFGVIPNLMTVTAIYNDPTPLWGINIGDEVTFNNRSAGNQYTQAPCLSADSSNIYFALDDLAISRRDTGTTVLINSYQPRFKFKIRAWK